ncbi:MAG TPA: DUF222 domain-containing protein [Ilumatobacteraceae bacterium]|nr:DUF222 domain-containing protein [Ilumatobacteraceae bacterium]
MTVCEVKAATTLLSIDDFGCAVTEWERQGAALALHARQLELTGAFGADGTVSMKSWMRTHLRMTNQRAGELLATGRFLDEHTHFARAALSGSLSASQVVIARRTGASKYAPIMDECEPELVELLSGLDILRTNLAVDHWITRANAVLAEKSPPAAKPCTLTYGTSLDDVTHGTFSLDEAAGTEFDTAIHTAMTFAGSDNETRTHAQRQGDALFDIAAFFNKNHTGSERPRNLPNVTLSADITTVITDHPEGVNVDTHRPMSPECTATYLCDCRIHVILRDADGTPHSFGRTFPLVPSRLFKQIAARDGGCRFPGCDRPVKWTDAHHIHWWEHGGTTSYDNLILLCSRHHHYVHQQTIDIDLMPTGDAFFTTHDGRRTTSEPRGAPPTRGPD